MTIISKIREKSGWAVSAIAIGLLLFIVGGDLISSNSSLFGSNSQKVGEIDGEDIMIDKYQGKINELESQFRLNSNKPAGEAEMQSIKEQAWQQLIFEIAYKKQFEKLGLEVTEDEVTDMIRGQNVHQSIRQAFVNQETKEFDKNLVIQYLQNFSKLSQQQQVSWYLFEKQVGPDRLRTKFDNLLSKTVYVTKDEASREYQSEVSKVSGKVLYVPFYSIADSTIKVDKSDITNFISLNPSKYKVEENVNLEYVSFVVTPSKEDSASILKELDELKVQFISTEDDTSFTSANSESENNIVYGSLGELPKPFTTTFSSFEIDSVYGPVFEGSVYKLYKVANVKSDTSNSIRASHILFRSASENSHDKVKAKNTADSVLNLIKKGENFELMARKFGTDGTSSQGGDLGWFSEGAMVKPFSDAVFKKGTVGLLNTIVETQFGYHIIKITAPKTNKKYTLFSLERKIIPSEATRELVLNKANQFISQANNPESFAAAYKIDSLKTPRQKADRVLANSNYVGSLNNPRALLKWAFADAKVGNVSTVFELDNGNQYVVALLTKKNSKGLADANDVKDEVSIKVRNIKKSELIIKKLSDINGSIEVIASKYGKEATIHTFSDLTLSSGSIPNVGFEPIGCGKVFGLKQGEKSKAFSGENGVLIVEQTAFSIAPEISDLSQYKNKLTQSSGQNQTYQLGEAIKEASKIEDFRYKF